MLARPDIDGLFVLNRTARILWEELASGATPEEIAGLFAAESGVPFDVALSDIQAMRQEWEVGLLGAPVLARACSGGQTYPHPEAMILDRELNGTQFRIALDPGEVAEELLPRLEPLRATGISPAFSFQVTEGDGGFLVARDGECIAIEQFSAGARAILLQEMTRLCEYGREWQAILHAGASGDESGCVLIAGPSYSGKSTLCAALRCRGFTCYGDDSAAIDREFRISGMPFPIMLREGSWPVLRERYAELDDLPVRRRWGVDVRFMPSNLAFNSSPAVPAKALLFAGYESGAVTRLQPSSALEALAALQASGFWVEHSRESIAGFLKWLGGLPCYRLRYSDLDEAIGIVARFLRREAV